ncbi:putative cation exchanger [Neolecta irregularis DAH-3]|uniref:Putative cation exchanger n=1 Tax=Neolecta irregularis (strain DAH-3) TaxID=1198029 RepID=A0A1U7LLE5_NEOID|nr:putative cation exchanger [Neolecta irregularis DAH-3]|eukprot:OLL23477.1 putative cation exchanger [Neolecta irregularis DAH-3]
MENAKFTGVVLLAIWLFLLFSTMGIAASEIFCANLAYIWHSLGISENIAGATFLAFGSGAPDVFNTFAVMKAGSGSLAVRELLGATLFIVAAILGSIAIVRPSKSPTRVFSRCLRFRRFHVLYNGHWNIEFIRIFCLDRVHFMLSTF